LPIPFSAAYTENGIFLPVFIRWIHCFDRRAPKNRAGFEEKVGFSAHIAQKPSLAFAAGEMWKKSAEFSTPVGKLCGIPDVLRKKCTIAVWKSGKACGKL
jgi:hypothetical protein